MSKLYVGNLAHETTEADLRTVFSPFGEISSIKIVSDRRGRVKGFAYVDLADDDATTRAMEALRGTQVNGRTMDIVEDYSSGRKSGAFRGGRRGRR
ncbi:MAG: RNA-binding protein [Dehalococcoidia bacterium]|nr:RNA-binding protein [Dehalococcoidia bacterium]